MMNQTLDTLVVGESGYVESIETDGSMRRRFLDIGLTPGCKVKCVLMSPNKNPIAYCIRGAVIAIRREDAKGIWIKKVENEC